MIIITGTIVGSDATIDDLLTRSLEHVRRSREEPGCLSHRVSRDVENPLRLVFFEQWADMAAVIQHFHVPAAAEFARSAGALSAEPATLELFEAAVTSPGSGAA